MGKCGLTDLFPKQKSESQKDDTFSIFECCKPKVQKSNKTLIVTVPKQLEGSRNTSYLILSLPFKTLEQLLNEILNCVTPLSYNISGFKNLSKIVFM